MKLHWKTVTDESIIQGYDLDMNTELLEIIVCPVCKGSLVLTEPKQGEIIEGTLHCKACDELFPIKDGIPNLIPPELRND